MKNSKQKSLKWLWIVLAAVVVIGLAVWCALSAINNPKSETVLGQTVVLKDGAENVFNFGSTFVLFVIAFAVRDKVADEIERLRVSPLSILIL